MVTILGRRELIAKKEHSCELCWVKIKVGEKYLRHVYKDDELYSLKYHLHCYKVVEEYLEAVEENDYTDQEVAEWVYEEARPYCEHCFKEFEYSETDYHDEVLKLCEECKKDSEKVWKHSHLEDNLNALKKARNELIKEIEEAEGKGYCNIGACEKGIVAYYDVPPLYREGGGFDSGGFLPPMNSKFSHKDLRMLSCFLSFEPGISHSAPTYLVKEQTKLNMNVFYKDKPDCI